MLQSSLKGNETSGQRLQTKHSILSTTSHQELENKTNTIINHLEEFHTLLPRFVKKIIFIYIQIRVNNKQSNTLNSTQNWIKISAHNSA